MKVIIAPDSFKDSMTGLEAAESIYLGFKSIFSQHYKCIFIFFLSC